MIGLSDDWQKAIVFGIAVWGAVTGTLALGINIRNAWKDRAQLTVEAEVRPDGWSIPVHKTSWKLTVTNRGRRPLSLRRAFVDMGTFWSRNQRYSLFTQSDCELTEGRSASLNYGLSSTLEVDYRLPIKRLVVEDTSGKKWKTSAIAGAALLIDVSTRAPVSRSKGPGDVEISRYRHSNGDKEIHSVSFSTSFGGKKRTACTETYWNEDLATARFLELVKVSKEGFSRAEVLPNRGLHGMASREVKEA